MRNRQRDTYFVYRDLQVLIRQDERLAATVVPSVVCQEFDAIVDELTRHALEQQMHAVDAQGGTRKISALKQRLREGHMLPIITISHTLAERIPGLPPFKIPTTRVKVAELIITAGALAGGMRPYVDHLVRLGLDPDCLEQLLAAADALNRAYSNRGLHQGSRLGAGVGVATMIERANVHLRAVDALVRRERGDDPQFMERWRAAKRLPAHGTRAHGAGALGAGQGATLALPSGKAPLTVTARIASEDAVGAGTSAAQIGAGKSPKLLAAGTPAPGTSLARRLIAGVGRLVGSGYD